jgi:hypothetical protein
VAIDGIRPAVNHLGGDRVDDVTDILVAEQQINELCDLDVVDGNLGLLLALPRDFDELAVHELRLPFRDNQVLLRGPLQF